MNESSYYAKRIIQFKETQSISHVISTRESQTIRGGFLRGPQGQSYQIISLTH